jgi:hypothetical protein
MLLTLLNNNFTLIVGVLQISAASFLGSIFDSDFTKILYTKACEEDIPGATL